MKCCEIFDDKSKSYSKNNDVLKIFTNEWGKSNNFFYFIPREIENNKSKLRKKYLEYINSIDDVKLFGQEIHNFFKIGSISYYYLSRNKEKSIYNSNGILDSIKFFSIIRILEEKKIKKVIFNSCNKNLKKTLILYCLQKNIFFENKMSNFHFHFNDVGRKLVLFLNTILQIRVYLKKEIYINNAEVHFFSYFLKFENIKKKLITQGYWGNLFSSVQKNKIKTQINYVFNKDKSFTINSARAFLFNKNNKIIENRILNSKISLQNFIKLIFYYSVLLFKSFFITKKIFKKNDINLYYFLKDDLYSSLRGATCVKNLFFNFCIKEFFYKKKKIKYGFYLFENQFWEKLINFYWKKNNHGELIAVKHSAIGFWDFRFCFDVNKKYLPNRMFSNSKYNSKLFSDMNFGKKVVKINEVSSLNYIKSNKRKKKNVENKILIVGDINFNSTMKLIKLSLNLLSYNKNIKLFLKPHPANIDKFRNKIPGIQVVQKLDLNNYGVATFTSTTSAYLDAAKENIKVCVYLDGENFNSCMNTNISGHNYFYDKISLIKIMDKKQKNIKFYYFNSNSNSLTWNTILKKIYNNKII